MPRDLGSLWSRQPRSSVRQFRDMRKVGVARICACGRWVWLACGKKFLTCMWKVGVATHLGLCMGVARKVGVARNGEDWHGLTCM